MALAVIEAAREEGSFAGAAVVTVTCGTGMKDLRGYAA